MMKRKCIGCGKIEDIHPKGARCKACAREYNQTYYNANREAVRKQVAGYRRENLEKARAAVSRRNKERWKELRQKALDAYGRECACCGESIEEFLCVDHINNDGAEHRKQIRNIAFTTYGWLERNNYPKGFQMLCCNCNQSKSTNGGVCIHQTLKVQRLSERSTPKRAEARSYFWDTHSEYTGFSEEVVTVITSK